MRRTMVVSVFAGCGKTWLTNHQNQYGYSMRDSDSSTYGCTQEITDAADSAAIWETGQGITVADHWNQGNYTNIQYSIPGSTIAYIDGTKYICTECFKGHNTGTCITDNAGNDVMNTLGAGKALLYTCNGCWQNVHVAIYQVAAS